MVYNIHWPLCIFIEYSWTYVDLFASGQKAMEDMDLDELDLLEDEEDERVLEEYR